MSSTATEISGAESPVTAAGGAATKGGKKLGLAAVNRELWLLLAMFAIALLLNTVVAEHQMLLGLYVLPTVFSAYYYGRRHAVLT